MRKAFVFLILFLGLFFVFKKELHAQVNGNNVGPELPYGTEGSGVIAKTGYTGTAAIILSLGGNVNNYAPSTKTIIRVTDIKHGASIQVVQDFANKLNNATFNNGAPTLVVFGNELNNLDPVEWNNPSQGETSAAQEYATLFNAFSRTINHSKYIVAPAPPDLYQGPYNGHFYDPQAWITAFKNSVDCSLVNTLVANIFKLDSVSDWKTKYTAVQQICGKSVTHFEGWGADPKASIKDQIDFLKTEGLPGGVSTGTSLIVNNCSGFGGNSGGTAESAKAWLYWIPTQPDKVYNADGSEFNYLTCSQEVVKKPYNLQDIPCDQTTDNSEFHNLRPYPASPCKKKVQETALMCGNDLIVKNTFHRDHDSAGGQCEIRGDGTKVCKFTELGHTNTVGINLKNAKLPIVGNTEDVPNATTNGSTIDLAQRLNNYVSWYLNGTINMTWEDDWSQIPLVERINRLVNYSGPLNKLLPFRIKMGERIDEVQLASEGKERHNQIALCTLTGTPTPCNEGVSLLRQIATFGGLRLNRFTAWLNHIPPKEEVFKSSEEFWKAFIQWEGGVCTPSVVILGHQFYACSLLGGLNPFAQYISYLLPSSTEDRVGTVYTDNTVPAQQGKVKLEKTIQLKDGQGNGGTVDNVSFTPDGKSSTDFASHNLYFSHMQEDTELAKLLQSTYATKADSNDANSWEGQLQNAIVSQNNAPKFETYGCEKQEIRTNPGDNLYGDIDRQTETGATDKQITGILKYDATFTCEFKPEKHVDQQCITSGGTESTCTRYSYNTCDKDIFVSLGIFTKTPKAYELSQRLVDGAMGVFKRFFPKVGPASVLTEIKDIPAAAKVAYTSTDGETRAGVTGRQGSDAQLFFPHIGSLEEYFLQGIQKALRPKDLSASDTTITGTKQCDINASATTATNVNGANYVISDGLIALALKVSKYTCTPAEFIIGVLAGETRGLNYNGSSDSPIKGDVNEKICRTSACVTGQSGALGPFSWTQSGYVAQANTWGNNAQACLSALGAQGGLDSKLLGQDMCITSAKFWGSMHDNGNVTNSCSGPAQRSYSLNEINLDGLKLAYMHFCGSDPRCEGYWQKDLQLIEAYKARVSTVRGQCTNP